MMNEQQRRESIFFKLPLSKLHNARLIAQARKKMRHQVHQIWRTDRPLRDVRWLIFINELRSLILDKYVQVIVFQIAKPAFIFLPLFLIWIGSKIASAPDNTSSIANHNTKIAWIVSIIYYIAGHLIFERKIAKHMECGKGGEPTIKVYILHNVFLCIPAIIAIHIFAGRNMPAAEAYSYALLLPIMHSVFLIAVGVLVVFCYYSIRWMFQKRQDYFYPAIELLFALKNLKSIENGAVNSMNSSKKASIHLARVSEYYAYNYKTTSELSLNSDSPSYNLQLSARFLAYSQSARMLTPGVLPDLLVSIDSDLKILSSRMVPKIDDKAVVNVPKHRNAGIVYSVIYIALGVAILTMHDALNSLAIIPVNLTETYKYVSVFVGGILIARGVFGRIKRIREFFDAIQDVLSKVEKMSSTFEKIKQH